MSHHYIILEVHTSNTPNTSCHVCGRLTKMVCPLLSATTALILIYATASTTQTTLALVTDHKTRRTAGSDEQKRTRAGRGTSQRHAFQIKRLRFLPHQEVRLALSSFPGTSRQKTKHKHTENCRYNHPTYPALPYPALPYPARIEQKQYTNTKSRVTTWN